MLAYELYLKNKESTGEVVKKTKPIKKIFVNKNNIKIDNKTREEYGSELTNDQGFIQDWLSMPLNTSNTKLLNLPDKRTGSRSSSPYIKIYGIYENNKSKEKISLSISGKDPLNLNGNKKNFVAELDLSKLELSNSKDHQPIYNFSAEGDLILNLDKKNYTISDQLLYEKYIKSEIIDRKDFFSPKKFIEISNKFFKYVKKMSKPDFARYNKTSFELYILPETGVIKYLNPVMLQYNENSSKNTDNNNKLENNSINRSTSNKNKETGFIDCFGNKCSQLASTSTQTAKFLSFDDPAFTINCTQKRKFYNNLDIGQESLEKINIPSDNVLNIRGLNWLFTDLSRTYLNFQSYNRGIYSQLYNNYIKLKIEKNVYAEKINLKVLCFKITQAKLEILLDTNMTMETMDKIFKTKDEGYDYSFEVLIERNDQNKNIVINNYIEAIRNLITQTPINKSKFIDIFTRLLRKQIFSWINSKNTQDPIDFFNKSDFCLKTLLGINNIQEKMDVNEKYAYSIGLIAGKYIKFKRKSQEESNSLKDILSYSKYDREKLRFVFSRVSIGLSLSKAEQSSINKVSKFINQNLQLEEIPDQSAFIDYSYFFFKGVYRELGGSDE